MQICKEIAACTAGWQFVGDPDKTTNRRHKAGGKCGSVDFKYVKCGYCCGWKSAFYPHTQT